jgi:hypothetical protein
MAVETSEEQLFTDQLLLRCQEVPVEGETVIAEVLAPVLPKIRNYRPRRKASHFDRHR